MSLEKIFNKIENDEINIENAYKMLCEELGDLLISTITINLSKIIEYQKSKNKHVRDFSRKLALIIPVKELSEEKIFNYLLLYQTVEILQIRKTYELHEILNIQNICRELILKVLETWKIEKLSKKEIVFFLINCHDSGYPNIRNKASELIFQIPTEGLLKEKIVFYLINFQNSGNRNLRKIARELSLTIPPNRLLEESILCHIVNFQKTHDLHVKNLSIELSIRIIEIFIMKKTVFNLGTKKYGELLNYLIDFQKSNDPKIRCSSRTLAYQILIDIKGKKEILTFLINYKSCNENADDLSAELALTILETLEIKVLNKAEFLNFIIKCGKSSNNFVKDGSKKLIPKILNLNKKI